MSETQHTAGTPDFEIVVQHGQARWMHQSSRYWIELTPRTSTQPAFWQVYRATVAVPGSRWPWELSYEQIGTAYGFKTFDEAAAAVRAHAAAGSA